VPTLSIAQPAKLARPAVAATWLAVAVQANVAPAVPVPVVMASATEAVLLVTVFP